MATPLVSCIMPTGNRRPFVARALAYFARQDYPATELVIVDDGEDPVGDLVPDDPRVSYRYLPRPMNTGDKRNLACELAHGLIIAQWDDDDWYGPQRLSYQVAPLLAGSADMTGIVTRLLDLERWQGWLIAPELHRQMFVGDVHGGTLTYWRWVWERLARYPSVQLAEDAIFQHHARRRGALLQQLPNADSFVYIRHGRNSWQFAAGAHGSPAGWQPVPPASLIPAEDLPFYAGRASSQPVEGPYNGGSPCGDDDRGLATDERSAGRQQSPVVNRRFSPPPAQARPSVPASTLAPAATPPCPRDQPQPISGGIADPLVTCIMPVCMRETLPRAIACFQRQSYPNRRLLIIDDGADDLTDLIPADSRVCYLRLARPLVLGHKCNLACELASSPLIAHWDIATWSAPERLWAQVAALAAHNAELCGSNHCLAYDPVGGRTWEYSYPAGRARFWVAGNSLCYTRHLWQRQPFAELVNGAEQRFLWEADGPKVALPEQLWAITLLAARGDTPPGSPGPYWRPYPGDPAWLAQVGLG